MRGPRNLLGSKPQILGKCQEYYRYACTVDSIYSAPNHSVSQFRVLLSHPDQPSTPRGWLIFSATVTKQNQAPQAPLPYVKSALRDNAATAECKRIGFEVRVYWWGAQAFPGLASCNFRGRDILSVSNSLSAAPPPHVYVKLRHASISTNLSTIRKTRDPTWNSSVCLPAVIYSVSNISSMITKSSDKSPFG
eukprot:Gregarina_sp_Poly_1__10343@NODE_735_length_6554_cov_122_722984_g550_i0_p3_GENE_NODE_735_length_6554_cov_122_722984_g550_i0NODE_735_length_6554_cov_122_722984_g550_i0_p3_ORF_typecomplete_len192_score10_37C2/PF00168_30/0_17_NODE_735_length_6554_cov_122_722984_g550_i044685043